MIQKRLLFLILILNFLLSSNTVFSQWQNGILLRGKICTMNDDDAVIEDGRVLITKEGIINILLADTQLPDDYKDVVELNTNGVIYPGLIDLHNHPAYNILPIWPVPQIYNSRYQWPRNSSYKELVRERYNYMWKEKKLKTVMGIYAEVKAMAGGTTTIQGLPSNKIYGKYLVRNAEQVNFGIDRIGANVLKISRSSQNFERTKRNLESNLDGWFYHLAEGTNPNLRSELYDLRDFDFNMEPIIGIHSTALDSIDFVFMDSADMKVIWSPLSNLLLYGATTKIHLAKKAGLLIGLGPDWSLSGSKNLLWELKVAALWNQSNLNNIFTPKELVQMVTVDAAKILKWEDKVGSIKNGLVADIIVTNHKVDDPYINLILCTEEDINLVTIGGEPYYGNKDFMKKLKRIKRKHDFNVITKEIPNQKAVDITREELMDSDFTTIYSTLKNEMGSDSFPVAPISPDPIYTGLDAQFFKRIWAVEHNPLDIIKLANFIHPIAKVKIETSVRESPGSPIIVKLAPETKVIIVKEASGRRRNWHEILMKTDEGNIIHGVVKKADLEIISTPEQFGESLFN